MAKLNSLFSKMGLLVVAAMLLATLQGCDTGGNAAATPPASTPTTVAAAAPTDTSAAMTAATATSAGAVMTATTGTTDSTPAAGATTAATVEASVPATPTVALPSGAGDMIIGISQEPPTLASWNADATVATYVLGAVEEGLIIFDPNGEQTPQLAESVPTLENGGAKYVGEGEDRQLVVTWKLRKGAKWSDGVDLTARDVVFGYNLVQNENVPVVDRSLTDKFFKVEATDDYTVVGTFLSQKQARDRAANAPAGAKDRLGVYAKQEGPVVDPNYATLLPVYPEHAYGKIAPDQLETQVGRNPIGSGPYKLRQWIGGQAIILEPNPYYGTTSTKPQFKTVIFKIVEDTNQLLSQVQTGQVKMAFGDALNVPNIPAIDELAKAGKVKGYYSPSTTWEHLDFNLRNDKFKDVRVRQAIVAAINRQRIVDQVLFGKSVVAHSWITPNIRKFYNPNVPKYAFDLSKTNELMTAAGFKKGDDGIWAKGDLRMSFTYLTTAGNALRAQVSQLVAGDLKAAGFEVKNEYMPAGSYFADDGPLQRGTFEFAEFAWTSSPDPGGVGLYGTAGIPTEANGFVGQNYGAYSNSENDQLLNDANNNADVALDPAKRAEKYTQQQLIFAQDAAVIPLYLRPEVSVAPTSLKNFKPTGSTTPPTWNIQEWSY